MKSSLTRRIVVALCLVLPVMANAQQTPSLPPLNDPPSGLSLPGKFTWFDLATPAFNDQKSFYSKVFGWTYRAQKTVGGEYVLIMNNDDAIAGMFEVEPPGGEQDGATWITLFSVTDVNQAVSTAKANGGKVEVEPADIQGRGRHALLRDPADALFGVLASSSGDSPDVQVPVGGILWVDLFARDVDAMAGFYSKLAPWTVTHRALTEEGNGRLLSSQEQPRAGLVPVDEEANRAAWVPYVRVDDVSATLERAVDGGGFVIVEPAPELYDGNLGIFVDPNGGVTGVVRYEYGETP